MRNSAWKDFLSYFKLKQKIMKKIHKNVNFHENINFSLKSMYSQNMFL